MDLTSLNCPHRVASVEEAQRLVDEAYALEFLCRQIKESSAVRAKQAIEEASLAATRLMEAEQHYGKIMYVVKASGFQAPPPRPTWAPIVVDIKGVRRSVSIPGDGFLEVILD